MLKSFKIITALILLMSFSQVLMAKNGCIDKQDILKQMSEIYKKIELTDEQKKKVMEIKKEFQERMKPVYARNEALIHEVNELLKNKPVDRTKLNSYIQQKKNLIAERSESIFKMKQSIYQLLTPEQQEKMKKEMESIKSEVVKCQQR